MGGVQKAARGESLDYFDIAKVKPRLERAAKSFEAGEYAFASELLAEIEGEGHLDPEIEMLRRRIDETMTAFAAKQPVVA